MKVYKMLFMALLLAVFVAGCSDDNNGGGGGAPADTTAPTVSSTNPVDSATNVAINQKITAIFSEPMASGTCTTTTFTLTQGVTPVSGSVTCVDKTAIFTPASDLAASTLYTATITTGMMDTAGNALAANKVSTFTTGTTADTTAPAVSSTTPANGDIGVFTNSTVNATFSEAMDPETITTATFTLKKTVAGTPVSGSVTSVGNVATFIPGSNLAASTEYTVTITTGAADLADNSFAGTTWTFTTGTTAAANPAAVNLGTSGNFVILSKAGITDVPTSDITGNVGTSPISGTAIGVTCAEVTGTIYSVDAAGPLPCSVTGAGNLATAVSDMEAAYTDAAGRTATSAATTNVGAGTLTGLTLTAGVYEWGSAVTIPTDLTLSGNSTDVWIFKVAGTLDMAAAKNVILAGSAQAKNVFWQVSGATSIGANTHFEGTILDQTAITFGNLASIDGRLLAQTAVNLDATTVTTP